MLRWIARDKYLIPAILTLAAGVWLSWHALSMPSHRGWASSPGLFPLFIGIGLVVMALVLVLEGKARGAFKEVALPRSLGELVSLPDANELGLASRLRPVVTFIWIVAYVLLLLRLFPFEVATMVFLVGSMVINGERSPVKILLLSLAFTTTIALIFIVFLQTLLPGRSGLLESYFY